MFKAILYNKAVQSKTMTGLKREMSKVANGFNNAIDEAVIQISDWKELCKAAGCEHWIDTTITMTRINKKYPNNTIKRGVWI
jgi:hypothetical protein